MTPSSDNNTSNGIEEGNNTASNGNGRVLRANLTTSTSSARANGEEDYEALLGYYNMSNDSQDFFHGNEANEEAFQGEVLSHISFDGKGVVGSPSILSYLTTFPPIIDQLRQERMKCNDSFNAAYNNGDFSQLFTEFYNSCDVNVRFIAPALQIECYGIIPLLSFFMLMSEMYPDSLSQNIERRIASIKASRNPASPVETAYFGFSEPVALESDLLIETVENIDKFTGTRVFHQPVVTIFRELLSEGVLNSPFLLIPDLTTIITNKLYEHQHLHHQMQQRGFSTEESEEKVYTFITESCLTFDLTTNKIIQWNYNILASQSN